MSKINSVYISTPLSTPISLIEEYAEVLEDAGFEVYYYDSTCVYTPRTLDESDALLVVLPNNAFKADEKSISSGVAQELARAYAQDKPIFLGYKPNGYDYSIYHADTNGKFITGIAGTANSIIINNNMRETKAMTENNYFQTYGNYHDYLEDRFVDMDGIVRTRTKSLEKASSKASKEPAIPLSSKKTDSDQRLLLMLG